ncbi:Protein transport protein sec20 [Amphichorda felina]
MSFEGLQERLSALQETTSQLKELIDRLAHLEFQPGSVPLDTSEEGSVSGELSAEIGNLLRDGDDEKELLQEEIEYLRHPDKSRLREGVERQGEELSRCRRNFRNARLAAKKSLAQAQRLERHLMIQSYSLPASPSLAGSDKTGPESASSALPPPAQLLQRHRPQHQNNNNNQTSSSLSEKDRQAVGASSRVTDSLRQMHTSLQAELERSEYANQTMRESTAAFAQLGESYGSLETMLTKSRDLLGTLLRSQKSDTWYLTTSLYMLMVVGGWLVFRRLLYGPMWWLVWLPLRILFGVGSRVGDAALQGRGQAGESGRVDGTLGSDGKVPVEGLPKEDLPTAKVGQQDPRPSDEGDLDSMVDKVGEIIDDAVEAGPEGNGRSGGETAEEERPKDEL